jgi:hypothetical protein
MMQDGASTPLGSGQWEEKDGGWRPKEKPERDPMPETMPEPEVLVEAANEGGEKPLEAWEG